MCDGGEEESGGGSGDEREEGWKRRPVAPGQPIRRGGCARRAEGLRAGGWGSAMMSSHAGSDG